MRVLPWILLLGSCFASEDGVTVETAKGKVRGYHKVARNGRRYLAFMGVPYAKPPLGKLRFQPTEPHEPWSGVNDVEEEGPYCIQQSYMGEVTGQEDCLHLSVYTQQTSGKAPVLVHFHGGAFTVGTSKWFLPDFLMAEDLVIVNANYRVGIFGFLSFETSEMPGNQGMKDQVLALRWVQENIKSFGGDPNLVTIIGESAGGASVYHHLVSPLSKGLFHRAISTSGTSYALWALGPPGFARSRAEKLMKLIGCPTNQEEAIPCALAKNATQIVSNFVKFSEWGTDPLQSFSPTLEQPRPGAFLTHPISKWEHNPVPLLIGMSSAEGLFRTVHLLKYNASLKYLSENFKKVAPFSLGYFASASNPDEISDKVRNYYLSSKEITLNDWVNLTTMYSDSLMVNSVLEGANKHKGDVFFYYFDYITESDMFKPFKKFIFGAFHCGDTMFIWNVTMPGISLYDLKGSDLELSRKLIRIWTTFAINGKPEGTGMNWEKWTPKNNFYIHINNNGFHLKKGLVEDRYKFWNSLNYRDNYDKGYKPIQT